MLESHLAFDFCLIGPKGCGKSTTVQRLADLLGYQVEPIVLYQASLSGIFREDDANFQVVFSFLKGSRNDDFEFQFKRITRDYDGERGNLRNETIEIFS